MDGIFYNRAVKFYQLTVIALLATASMLSCALAESKDGSIELTPVDVEQALLSAKQVEEELGILPFAVPHDMEVSPATHGTWSQGDDYNHWHIEFTAENATDMNVGFSKLRLPAGAELFLSGTLDDGESYVVGPIGNQFGSWWSAPIPGETLALDLMVPVDADGFMDVEISRVSTGYRDLFKQSGGPGFAKQAYCHNDVVCPAGDAWRNEIRSVAAYTAEGSYACTGTLLMDAEGSFRPFFLTANHCGVTPENANTVVTIWNYHSPECGMLSGGSKLQTISGATYRAGRRDADFTLLELSSAPPESFNVHYAGWDRSDVAPQGGAVTIHHPGADEKAITLNFDPVAKSNNCIGSGEDTHWEVDNWENGSTEQGSSGAGLWDMDSKLLIGQLSGGLASCDDAASDCFGRIGVAFTGGTNDAERLAPWLDPNQTGVLQVAGADGLLSMDLDEHTKSMCTTQSAQWLINLSSRSETIDVVDLTVEGLPAAVDYGFSSDPAAPNDTVTLTVTDNGGLEPGSHMFDVIAVGGNEFVGEPAQIEFSDDLPASPMGLAVNTMSVLPQLQWQHSDSMSPQTYQIQIATDASFSNVVADAVVQDASYTPNQALAANATYYWRVRSGNGCGDSTWTTGPTFTTPNQFCEVVKQTIKDRDTSGLVRTISSTGTGFVSQVTVDLLVTHPYTGDLKVELARPQADVTAALLDRPLEMGTSAYCDGENIQAQFSDSGAQRGQDVCDSWQPAVEGTVQPLQAFEAFQGLDAAGDWQLRITDNQLGNIGQLTHWCVTISKTAQPAEPALFSSSFE